MTCNNFAASNSWFDIRSLDMSLPEDEEGIKSASKKVHELIELEEKAGLSSEQVMLGGFSQGGALALYSALTYPKKLAGVIALSCWLPLHEQFPTALAPANKDLAVLQCHGDSDPVVFIHHGRATNEVLKKMLNKDNVQFQVYPGMQHSANDQELKELRKFVDKHLPAAK